MAEAPLLSVRDDVVVGRPVIHAYSEARAAREPDVVVVRRRLPGGEYLFRVVEPRRRPRSKGINVNWT